MVPPSNQTLLTQWSWDPSVLIGLIVLSGTYAYLIGPLRRRHRWGPPASRRQIGYFLVADVLLFLSLQSPLDVISDRYLFSGHMVQHLVLATLWPPLMLMATPIWLARRVISISVLAPLLSFLVQPVIALMSFNLDVYLWHLPALYNATLDHEPIHIAEHLSFMFFGLINWWPVLSPIPDERLSSPMQILYLIADGMFMMVLGILFTFAPDPFYSTYTHAPRLWGLSASSDQQLGGLIMWYPGNIPYAILLVVAFYRWFDSADPDYLDRQPIPSPTIDSPAP